MTEKDNITSYSDIKALSDYLKIKMEENIEIL